MTIKIALLRGINVGGHRKILMADLKQLFEKQGFKNISTYIQSGNVIFVTTETNNNKIAEQIEQAIKQKYGYDVAVIVLDTKELEQAVKNNPFCKSNEDTKPLHLTFLNTAPSKEAKEHAQSYSFAPDKFSIYGQFVYIFCQGKYHETKISNNFFESKLKVKATTRNWKTVLKLLEMTTS